jgi:hypothetical protein
MKKYIIGIFAFFLCFFCADRLVGYISYYLVEHAISGETQKNEYICDRTNEDILILGSSRAVHHYDPRIIEDSLGLSCYNCGYDGCGSITAYGLLNILSKRYSPKVIIYEITPEFDYLQYDKKDNTKYLGPLKNYYDREGIDSVFMMVSPIERWKMYSYMYRINSKAIQMLSENIIKRNETIKGFHTKETLMSYEPDIDDTRKDLEYDDVKILYLKKIISLCKNHKIKLIFSVSPSYKKTDSYAYTYAKDLAKVNDIPFISHYADTLINRNKKNFYDQVHMNMNGAQTFTKVFVSDLKNIINK